MDQWEQAMIQHVNMNYEYEFEVGTSAKNKGSFIVKNETAKHMSSDTDIISYQDRFHGPTKTPGFSTTTTLSGFAYTLGKLGDLTRSLTSVFTFDNERSSLDGMSNELARLGGQTMKEALGGLSDNMKTTIMLPAGDVMMFKGLSADGGNNVLTTVTFDSPTKGSCRLQKSS
jgi:hypothetical protein